MNILGKKLNREVGLLFLSLGEQQYVPGRIEVAHPLLSKCILTAGG